MTRSNRADLISSFSQTCGPSAVSTLSYSLFDRSSKEKKPRSTTRRTFLSKRIRWPRSSKFSVALTVRPSCFVLLWLRRVSVARPSLANLTSFPPSSPSSSFLQRRSGLLSPSTQKLLIYLEWNGPSIVLFPQTRRLSIPSIADLPPSFLSYPLSHYPTLPSWYKSKSPASSYSPLGYQLLQSLFEFDPEKRITAREALACPWFTEESPKPSLK